MTKLLPKHKNLKFENKAKFDIWLQKTTAYEITFEDTGQDFLVWFVDKRGEVIHSDPFQSQIWNGKMLDLRTLKKGKYPTFLNSDGFGVGNLKHKIIKVVKI